jgi:hypothetical protein
MELLRISIGLNVIPDWSTLRNFEIQASIEDPVLVKETAWLARVWNCPYFKTGAVTIVAVAVDST